MDADRLLRPRAPGRRGRRRRDRTFKNGRYRIREEIVERRPQERLVYALLSGLPLRDYRAEIDLTPQAGGTEIRWHTTFAPKFPGTGRLFRGGLAKVTQQFVDGLVEHSAGGPTAV